MKNKFSVHCENMIMEWRLEETGTHAVALGNQVH